MATIGFKKYLYSQTSEPFIGLARLNCPNQSPDFFLEANQLFFIFQKTFFYFFLSELELEQKWPNIFLTRHAIL